MDIIKFCCDSVVIPVGLTYNIINDSIIFKHNSYQLTINIITENNNIILSSDDTILGNHFMRIIKNKFKTNTINIDNFYDIFVEIINLIPIIHSLCTICNKKTVLHTNILSLCDNDKCYTESMLLWTDNIITNSYDSDNILFKTLLEISVHGATSPNREKVYSPFPPQLIDSNNKNRFDKLDELLPKKWITNDFSDIITCLKKATSDKDVFDYLKKDLYGFIKFTLISNKTKLKSETIHGLTNDIIFFEVTNDLVKKNKYDMQEPEYLFHGSSFGNWYSIMRNGLKNYSGTANMVNGAAHGSGIYLSDSANMSFGYSRMNNTGCNGKIILGVIQVNGNKEQYKKTPGIYVVPNESDVLLKYIVVFNGAGKANIECIQEYFMKSRVLEIKGSQVKMNEITCKRIVKELSIINKKINKYPEKFNLQISDINSSGKIMWQILFPNKIYVDIVFTYGYPFDPPFAMISKTKININGDTQNIFNNGCVVLQKLLPKNWNPKTTMVDIITDLVDVINNLSFDFCDGEYIYDTVLSEYNKFINKMF